ncbi:MAG: hypothetical protein E2O92_08670 [Alphaproteobacteria bacterium]|nr:MAG: hypothetical protein E2O92_08670 [Alphaproteobacteria bacterium]
MLNRVALGLIASGMLMTAPMAAYADHHEADEAPAADAAEEVSVNCIDTRRIKSTRAIDNQTIIFDMRGGTDYKMTTVNRCSGLKMQGTIIYSPTPSSRLCAIDTIKVPITTSGGLFNTSFTHCPIDKIVEYQKPEKKVE